MELITARTGKPHITPMQDAMWHRGLTETDSCIFDAFEKFKADIITANEIRVRSGVGMIQGRFFEIAPNTYDPAVIANGTQGQKRIDLIVCRVTVNESENTQKAEMAVIQGTPTTGTPQTPAPVTGDLDNGDTVADYPLYAVNISGITITSVTPQFETGWLLINGTLPVAKGGTGETTAAAALAALGGASIKLAWENASPASKFAPQTISINGLQQHDLVAITFAYSTGGYTAATVIEKTDVNTKISANVAASQIARRTLTLINNGIQVAAGEILATYGGTAATNNGVAIPRNIILIKQN